MRSIHAQNRPVEQGEAGQRCALVLSGPDISKEAVRARRCRARSGAARADRAHRCQPARAGVRAEADRAVVPGQGASRRRRGAGPRRRAARRADRRRARRTTCSWCWSGRSRRRPATASWCATPPRAAPSAAACSSTCARRSGGGARRSGAPRSPPWREKEPADAPSQRCWRVPAPGSTSTPSAATGRSARQPSTASISDLSLVTFALGTGRAAMLPADLGAPARRASASTLDAFHAEQPGPARHRPRAAAQGREAAAARAAFPGRAAQAGRGRRGRARPHLGAAARPRGEVLRRGGADLGADPPAPRRRALPPAAGARHRQGHGHRRGASCAG